MNSVIVKMGLLAALVIVASLAGGCGTIMHGKTQNVIVDTNPPNAVAKTDDGQTVTTPGTLVLKRGRDYMVTFEKEGYEPTTQPLSSSLSGWVFGNIIAGGIIGLAVDFSNGAAYNLDPERMFAQLKEGGGGVAQSEGGKDSGGDTGDVDKVAAIGRSQPHAHALVIGIEQYRQKIPKADYSARDAKIMAQYLIKTLGYPEENVAVLINDKAAKSDVEKYVEQWLPNRVEKGDMVFVYYSGHGAPNSKTGDAYLVPYDGDPTFVDSTGYSLKRLYDNLGKLQAKQVVVVMDSCFSGAGGRSVIAKGMRPMGLSMGNVTPASMSKTVVLAASSGEQTSSTYEAKRHGLLTYYVMKGLKGEADANGDGAIDLTELFDFVKPQVERLARREFNNEQTPQLIGSAENLKGGVVLMEKKEKK